MRDKYLIEIVSEWPLGPSPFCLGEHKSAGVTALETPKCKHNLPFPLKQGRAVSPMGKFGHKPGIEKFIQLSFEPSLGLIGGLLKN